MIELEEIFGFISVAFLFIAMFAGPLYRIFPNAPLKSQYRSSLGGFGISAFYFAFLHSYISFRYLLGGWNGIGFLNTTYLWADLLGFVSLLILAILAGTSFSWAMKALGAKWKTIHRFVYVAGIALIIHVLLIGAHFRDLTDPISFLFTILFLILLIFNAITLRRFLIGKYINISSRICTALVCGTFILFVYLLFLVHEIIAGTHIH